MESIRVNRSEVVGKTQNNTAVLEALIRANALELDGIGFTKVSEKFVDNFMFCNIVPDYHTKKDKRNKLNKVKLLKCYNQINCF